METLVVNYVMLVHDFWKTVADSEFITFRNALFYSLMVIAGIYWGFKGTMEVSRGLCEDWVTRLKIFLFSSHRSYITKLSAGNQ